MAHHDRRGPHRKLSGPRVPGYTLSQGPAVEGTVSPSGKAHRTHMGPGPIRQLGVERRAVGQKNYAVHVRPAGRRHSTPESWVSASGSSVGAWRDVISVDRKC